MKLIEVNKNGTSTFLLNDGRKIKSYQSGYVRIDNSRHDRLYQINKRIDQMSQQIVHMINQKIVQISQKIVQM